MNGTLLLVIPLYVALVAFFIWTSGWGRHHEHEHEHEPHRQVPLEDFEVDEGIVDLITHLRRRGMTTLGSCQGYECEAFVIFETLGEAQSFFDIVADEAAERIVNEDISVDLALMPPCRDKDCGCNMRDERPYAGVYFAPELLSDVTARMAR